MAMSSSIPVAKDSSTTSRATGNPSPSCCEDGWGYASWFAGVSGMLTVVPSTR